MPMKPRTPKQWSEDEEGNNAVYNHEERYSADPDIVYSEEEDIVPERELTTNRSKTDLLNDKIELLEQKRNEKQLVKDQKDQIRDKKRQIRRLQYSPVYQGASIVASGVSKTVSKFTGNDLSPEEKMVRMNKRAVNKERVQKFMQNMEKFGDTGNSGTSFSKETVNNRNRDMGLGGKGLDFLGNGRSKPKDFIGSSKSKKIDFIGGSKKNIDFNLFGNSSKTTKGKKTKSKKKKMELM